MSEPAATLTEERAIDLTLADHFAVIARGSRRLLVLLGVTVVLALALWLAERRLWGGRGAFPGTLLVSALVAVALLFGLVTPLLAHLRVRRMLKGQPIRIQLTQAGVTTRLPEAEGTSYWGALKRVVRSRDRLFLFTEPATAFVIARRYFDDPADFERWCAIAGQRFAQAQDSPSARTRSVSRS